jgi:hypothetical protein
LVAALDDVPVDLSGTNIDAIVELDVEATAKRHREACFFGVEISDAEDGSKLRTINVDLLIGNAEQRVRERFEARAIFIVVLDLDPAKEVLDV